MDTFCLMRDLLQTASQLWLWLVWPAVGFVHLELGICNESNIHILKSTRIWALETCLMLSETEYP